MNSGSGENGVVRDLALQQHRYACACHVIWKMAVQGMNLLTLLRAVVRANTMAGLGYVGVDLANSLLRIWIDDDGDVSIRSRIDGTVPRGGDVPLEAFIKNFLTCAQGMNSSILKNRCDYVGSLSSAQ